jgi:acyl-CoA reductase-like NAD-dependent aldehyde dehydrogenase
MLGLTHFSLAIPETAFGGVKDSGFGSDGCVKGLDALMTLFGFRSIKSNRNPQRTVFREHCLLNFSWIETKHLLQMP